MSPQLIKLLISLLAVLIIGIQVMFGAIRGLKKSVFRLIWIFVWGVVCILISSLIAKALVNVNISFLHLSVNGEQISTLPEYIQKLLESSNPDIAQAVADNPQIYDLCVQVAISIINLVVFELLFWVVKWLLYPVWAILARVFFKKSKKGVKPETKNVYLKDESKKIKKHGWWGALIGIASGIVVVLFAFIPLKTVSDLALLVEAETTVKYDGATQKGLISQYAGDYEEYFYVYNDSIINKVLNYTGIGYVQDFGGDILLNAKYNGNKINLKNEVKLFGNAYVNIEKITNYDYDNITKTDIAEILELADDMQTKVLSSGVVQSVYEVAPYFVKNILTNEDYFIKLPHLENETLDKMLRDSAKAVFGITDANEIDKTKLSKIEDVKSDLSKSIALVKELNQQDLVAGFVNGQMTFAKVQENITVEVAEDLIDGVFDLHLINKLAPIVAEPSLEALIAQVPSVEYNSTETTIEFTSIDGGIKTEDLKSFLKSAIANTVGIIKGIDTDSKIYINSNDFAKFGAILDDLKTSSVISRDTFDSTMNYVSTYAKKLVDETSLDADAKTFIISMAEKIGGVGSYELELAHVGDAYKIYKEAETFDLNVAKEMFDELLTTYIYTSSRAEIYDYVEDKLADIDLDDLNNIKTEIIEQFDADEENNVNVISVVIQLKDIAEYIEDIEDVVPIEDIDRQYLLNLGDKIDNLSANFDLVINANAQRMVGEYVAETIYNDVPNDSEHKTAVANTFNQMETYDSFKTMFGQFADDLELA